MVRYDGGESSRYTFAGSVEWADGGGKTSLRAELTRRCALRVTVAVAFSESEVDTFFKMWKEDSSVW